MMHGRQVESAHIAKAVGAIDVVSDDPQRVLDALCAKHPRLLAVITIGPKGVIAGRYVVLSRTFNAAEFASVGVVDWRRGGAGQGGRAERCAERQREGGREAEGVREKGTDGGTVSSATDFGRPMLCCSGAERWAVKSIEVELRDTTGAGDAFKSGFLFGWHASAGDVLYALQWGSVCGSSCVETVGASTPSDHGVMEKRLAVLQGAGISTPQGRGQ